jgi:hypothetical protein
MDKYNQIISLLEQIIEKNVYYDNLNKTKNDSGDNWDVHHLKLLKTLIEDYERDKNAKS